MPPAKRALLVMMISDAVIGFLGGRVLQRESPEEFVLALEHGWIRTFGPMKILQVDDYGSWFSDYVKSWCSENESNSKSPWTVHKTGNLGEAPPSDKKGY